VVDVLVGDDQQLDLLDRVPARGQRLFELVQRLARVGAGVDERQRRVLDQVGVHAANLEGGGDREAVDALFGGLPQQLLLAGFLFRRGPACLACRGHDRIKLRTSSRRRSMSSTETNDSRHSRNSGSVFEERTLKCQSG